MKHSGSTSDFIPSRNEELYQNIIAQLRESAAGGIREACARAIKMPASRYWVCERRAAQVISELRRRGGSVRCNGPKQRMYMAIMAKAGELQEIYPDWPLIKVVSEIVWGEASEFYMEVETAYQIYLKERRKAAKRFAMKNIARTAERIGEYKSRHTSL